MSHQLTLEQTRFFLMFMSLLIILSMKHLHEARGVLLCLGVCEVKRSSSHPVRHFRQRVACLDVLRTVHIHHAAISALIIITLAFVTHLKSNN